MESFRAEMARHGLQCPGQLAPDGRLHRFKAAEDKARNSWYVLHAGPPLAAGAFGCWRRGISETWCEREPKDMSQADWDATRKRWQEAERQTKARATAQWILNRTAPANSHPYLTRKGVQVRGELRQNAKGLVIPLRDIDGTLHSLQFIDGDGGKRFLPRGRVAGCFFIVADNAGPLALCEGVATGLSIHAATGYAVVCAMNCGNLLAVAQALRATWPDREIILAADNDAFTKDKDGKPLNSGVDNATEAAKAIHARLAIPVFKDVSTKPTDFNDLATLQGLAAVKEQIDKAEAPKESDEEIVSRLAALPLLEYERQREAEAVKLGCRASILDKLVDGKRPKAAEANGTAQGKAVELPSVEPWPEPVDGAAVLDSVAATFTHYIVLPDGAADALSLWTAHAHCFEAFEHSPRLNLNSPDKGCAKTLTLDVVATMTPRALRTESITPAVLFRLVEGHKPTLLLDEVDAYLTEAEELRGLLNAGHKRGACAYRCEGESNTVRSFAAFAPAALAGIGELPGTLHDRSIVVPLVRAKPGEVPQRFDSRRTAAESELCRKLARWAADHFERLKACDPKLPEGAFNRLADNWRPLFAIAETAGGEWPARAAKAFVKLMATDDMSAQGIGTMLLADIAAVFADTGVDRLASEKLAETLAGMEGKPWPEWGKSHKPISPNQVAKQLRKFGVSPDSVRVGDKTPKGYHLSQFLDVFERFLPSNPFSKRNTATNRVSIDENANSEPQQPEAVLRPENAQKPNNDGQCCVVAVQKPLSTQNREADLL
jgi:putative DNA primase/helicase